MGMQKVKIKKGASQLDQHLGRNQKITSQVLFLVYKAKLVIRTTEYFQSGYFDIICYQMLSNALLTLSHFCPQTPPNAYKQRE